MCSVEGCSRKVYAKKLCSMHYARVRKNGAVGKSKPFRTHKTSLYKRVMAKIAFKDHCILCLKKNVDFDGHPYFYVGGKKKLAHQIIWEHEKDRTLNPGEEVNLTCLEPTCVNMNHIKYEITAWSRPTR